MSCFCFDHDGLEVAFLHFISERHCVLNFWDVDRSWAVSRIAACFRRNASPIMAIDVWFMTMDISSKVYRRVYVASGCSSSALAYSSLKGGGGALFMMHWLAS